MSRKVVITCAVTGSHGTKEQNPAIPVTPEEIAQSGLDAAAAGASVLHIHVRNPQTGRPSMELAHYEETVDRIRQKNPDVILNLTTGPGARFVPGKDDPRVPGEGTTLASPAVRLRHIEKIKPPICTLDVASMNFGEQLFANTPAHLREMADRAKAVGTKPEIEVFDLGHIMLAKKLLAEGHIDGPPLFQICLGISYGAPATPQALMHMHSMLPEDAIWSGFGISRDQFPIAATVTALGGHVRVGLEDNLYSARGVLAPSNAALVERAAKVIELIGPSVATPAEAREIFGVKAQ